MELFSTSGKYRYRTRWGPEIKFIKKVVSTITDEETGKTVVKLRKYCFEFLTGGYLDITPGNEHLIIT